MSEGTKVPLSKGLTVVLALACGTIVANLYFAQPLIKTIATSLHSSPASTSLVVSATQAGYAVGLFLLVPLGDILNRRLMISRTLLLTTAALVAAAVSPNLIIFILASIVIGLSCVVAQVIVPFASLLAAEEERGRVVGTVMTGLLLGILFARTFSGVLAQLLGWRSVYVFGALATFLLSFVLSKTLPKSSLKVNLSYKELISSVVELVKTERELRVRSYYGALSFGIFSALWASIALLLSKPPYSYNAAVIGLFGLVGVGGTLAANLAGRLADKGRGRQTTGIAAAITLIGFAIVAVDPRQLIALIAGVLLIDMGVQGVQISNQAVVFALDPKARSRISGAYMTSYFVGGAVFSALSSLAYAYSGWSGVGAIGISLSLILLISWALERRLAGAPAH